MGDLDGSTSDALSNDREVFSHFVIIPVQVSVEIVFFACLHLKRPVLSLSILEWNPTIIAKNTMFNHVLVFSMRIVSVSCFDLRSAFIRNSTLLPRLHLQVNGLSSG